MVAGFDMISFGFYVALNALTPVWLQKPKKVGGYGFTITENATFTLVHWIGVFIGLVYGQLVSDRIPLWLAARNKGVWKPEYRLHALWLTNFILMPIGLGLVGAALQHRLHWIVFAIGQVFVTIGSLVSIPVTVKYVSSSATQKSLTCTLTDMKQLHRRMLQITYYRGHNSRQLDATLPRSFNQLLHQQMGGKSHRRVGIWNDGILYDFLILLSHHLDVERPRYS
jgi:hypothetical protein